MRKFSLVMKLALILMLLWPSTRSYSSEPKKKESFYSQVTRAVIRLEHYEDIQKEGQPNPSRIIKTDGTAFFVHTAEDDLYVVTAGHVARKDYDLHARVPTLIETTGKVEVAVLRLSSTRWVFHPEGGNARTHPVDVAVMKIPNLKGAGVVAFLYCLQDCPEGKYNHLEQDPEPPEQIMVFGFPLNIGLQLKEARPMGRQGIVALKAEEEFMRVIINGTSKYAEHKAFLLDAKVFPGNSGSPVMRFPGLGRKFFLLGLISAANATLDFAVAEPVSRIREVIDQAKNKTKNFDAWNP